MINYKTKLNIGCGSMILNGWLNLDVLPYKGVDVDHNLNKFPYPFKDNQFEEILASNILEHLDEVFKVMEEIWRISKSNALLHVYVPHFSGLTAVTDPSHKSFFSSNSFDLFQKEGVNNYYNQISKVNFKVLEKKIIFSGNKILKIFNPLVNINRRFYERFLAYIFPSQTLYFKLKILK